MTLYDRYRKQGRKKKLQWGGDWTQIGNPNELGQGEGIKLNKPAHSPYAYQPMPQGDNTSGSNFNVQGFGAQAGGGMKGAGGAGNAIVGAGFAVGSAAMDGLTDVNRPRGYYEQSGGEMRTQDGMKYGAMGAKIGSSFGPIGSVIGGAVGMAGGYFMGKKREKNHNDEVAKRQANFVESENLAMRYNRDSTNGTGNRDNQYYAMGGPLKRDPSMDAISTVLTQRNKDLPWVNRALQGNTQNIPDSKGNKQTHRLSTGDDGQGNYYVYPEITQRDGELFDGTKDRGAAHRYAIDNKLTMPMPSRSMAEYYSQQGLIKHELGGKLVKTLPATRAQAEEFYSRHPEKRPKPKAPFKAKLPTRVEDSQGIRVGKSNEFGDPVQENIKVNYKGKHVGYRTPYGKFIGLDAEAPKKPSIQRYSRVGNKLVLQSPQKGDFDPLSNQSTLRERYLAQERKRERMNPAYVSRGTLAMGGSLGTDLNNTEGIHRLSSNGSEVKGPSHAQGGVDIPQANAEVEGGETIADDYVFSKQLGFAKLHKPIALAKGKVEKKPMTRERINSLKLLNSREARLKAQQELMKKQLNLQ